MLSFVFGGVANSVLHLRNERQMAGFIACEKADIRWFLSVDRTDLPDGLSDGRSTYRAVTVDGDNVSFPTVSPIYTPRATKRSSRVKVSVLTMCAPRSKWFRPCAAPISHPRAASSIH